MTVMTGKEALMELLSNNKVKYVFGLPGATEVVFMDALEKRPDIKYILGLNESVVVAMAEGYARVTGEAGVVNLHTHAGLAAAMGMLDNAYRGRVPLVVTAGQQPTHLLIQNPPLSGDMVKMAGPVTKWSTEVLSAADIPITIQRAFKVAFQPPAGPVFISLPYDVLNQSLDFEYTTEMRVYNRMRPEKAAITQAAELLAKASTPIMVVETGVARNNTLSEVVKLAEVIGARVYQSWMSDVNFPVSHAQYLGDLHLMGPKGKQILQAADVLVLVGSPLWGKMPLLSKNTQVVQIDDDPSEIGRNFPVTCGIPGDIKASLIELKEILEKNRSKSETAKVLSRVKLIAGEKEVITSALRKKAVHERDNVPIAVSRLMQDLKDSLEPETFILDDGLSSSTTIQNTFDLTKPFSYQRARGGSIGWGLPAAIGCKLGAPDHPVVSLCGDGAAIWSIQSLWSAAHYNVPVTFVIINNGSYRTVKQMRAMILSGGKLDERHEGMDLDKPAIDFCRLAQAMGIEGRRVERPEKLKDILKLALRSGVPNLVEVRVENPP